MSSQEDAQYTDVHYRSLNGEGNFNWRMIFPLKFSIAEDMMIIEKHKVTGDTSKKMPAILTLQIWDNDTFTPDDFLGTMSINLSHIQSPSKVPEKCLLDRKEKAFINLFGVVDRSLRGWFPVRGKLAGGEEIKQTVSWKEF